MVNLKRIAAGCGVVAPVIAMLALFVPTFLTPSFSWTGTSISHMGGVGRPAAFVLNYGLIAAGVVGMPFVAMLLLDADNPFQTIGSVLFGVSVLGMIGVGLNPVSPDPDAANPTHLLAALTHFLSYTIGLWVYGSGTALSGRVRRGLVTVWLGIVHVMSWIGLLLFIVIVQPPTIPGIAIPEAVGSVAFAGWLLVTARGYLTDGSTTTGAAADVSG